MNKELLYQNKKIFYRIVGSGIPVVLIHGFGEDGTIWNNQVEYLKDKYKLIIPDLPGSGQSELIDDMSLEGMAEVIKSVIDAEYSEVPPCGGFRGAPVIAHSMGGYILLALVEKYWNHVSAFGLFHSTAYPDSEEKKVVRRKGIEFINQHGAFEFLETTTPNLFSQQTKDEQPELISELIASLDNFSPAALVSYYEAMMQRPDRTKILQKATVPVLFIMGKYDNAVPFQDGLQQCHLPEKSYIYVLRNSGHMGMLEESDSSNQILETFLTSFQ
ncbi:MAG TPA: alpha/beta hydrolase [Chitinophagaceae bacterium]|nr:alpha/beta hydrolase [Chitinophagaceae bacterium]